MTPATIGELLRRHRRRANLTQKDLAKAINCNHSLVSRVETGDYYFVEVTKKDVTGRWGGIAPSPRLWFRVKDSQ